MKITLKEGRRLVASKVNECPQDPATLDDIIHLATLRAWETGDWWGIKKRLIMRIIDGRIVLPPEFGVLEAINLRGRPRMIRDEWFEFHPNGPGTRDCTWHSQVFDLMEVPTLFKIYEGEQVMALSRSKNGEDIVTEVVVQGINTDGETIYSYKKDGSPEGVAYSSDLGESITVAKLNENSQWDAGSKTYNLFADDGITNIFKPKTRGPIEIYAVGLRGMRKLTTMLPGQTQSSLRAYRVPEGCCCGECVEALVRLAEPEKPTQDHDVLLIQSPTALIYLCMSIYYSMYTQDPDKGEVYLQMGIRALNGQLNEKRGTETPLLRVVKPGNVRNKRRQPPSY